MRSLARCIVALLALTSLAGCYSRAEMQTKLRTQASDDLGCPADKLNVYEMSDSVSQVDGCGRKKSYIGVCAHFECKWINNDGATVAQFFHDNTRPVTRTKSTSPVTTAWRPPPTAPARRK